MNTVFLLISILGAATILSYYFGRLIKKIRLPSIIGYLVLGVFLGSSGMGMLDELLLQRLEFLSSIVLGLVAFAIGAELNIRSLRKLGQGIATIIVVQSFAAFVAVTLLMYWFTGDLAISILYGSLAPATAPAGTVAVIQENKARGRVTRALYALVGFDDALAIIIFGLSFAVVKNLLATQATTEISESMLTMMWVPIQEILLSSLLGIALGILFSIMITTVKTRAEMLVIVIGTVLVGTGLSLCWNLSLFLTNMGVGMVFANTTNPRRVKAVLESLSDIMPLLFIWFFSLAGAHLQLGKLYALGEIGVIYILGRTIGKLGGTYLGGIIGGADKRVTKWTGLGVLSQAGVAIGLSLIVKSELSMMNIPGASELGTAIITTITASCIFFEVIGPICTKYTLQKAGEIPQKRSP